MENGNLELKDENKMTEIIVERLNNAIGVLDYQILNHILKIYYIQNLQMK